MIKVIGAPTGAAGVRFPHPTPTSAATDSVNTPPS